ncbi:MAG: PQQ-dependent sugar dehydrogenase [Paraglaciecola sp.]|uniref:PQQ-dependent sugar dehydrogenase n=1 Tax=Paraglaciecola sp. TaxID=1920173 RepID=UPI003298C2E0
MYRHLIKRLLLFCLVVALPAESQTINLIEGIKIKNGHRDEALFYYNNNWRALRKEASELGYVQSFELMESNLETPSEFDILLITKYATQSDQEQAEARFEQIMAHSGAVKLLNTIQPNEFRKSVFVKMGRGEQLTQPTINEPVKEVVIDGLAHPWSMAFLSEDEVLVSEKDGHLVKVNLLTKHKSVIHGFPEDLANNITIDASQYEAGIYPSSLNGRTGSFNMGIFDVVLDPNFATNQLVYVAYAAQKRDSFTTKVIRATLQNDRLIDVKPIFVADPYTPGAWHFGGGLTFAIDGKLYITIGERLFNEVNQPDMPIAQNLQDKRGKIHRINPDGSIPLDNPKFANNTATSIYAIGIRAAQGLTVDPNTGHIWFSEHGTHQGDEINLLQAGANYGWPIKTTGTYRHKTYKPPTLSERTFTDPTWYWRHTVAPTGLTFYTGNDFPQWKNDLLVSGLSRGSLWRLRIVDNTIKAVEELFVDDRVRSRKIVQSPAGKLYLLTDEDDGKIISIRKKQP